MNIKLVLEAWSAVIALALASPKYHVGAVLMFMISGLGLVQLTLASDVSSHPNS